MCIATVLLQSALPLDRKDYGSVGAYRRVFDITIALASILRILFYWHLVR